LLASAKEKLKKGINTKNLINDLDEFLKLQKLIVYSDNKQEICDYLQEKQLLLRQNLTKQGLTKKNLNNEELSEIGRAKEELTKLEIRRSILTSSSNLSTDSYVSVRTHFADNFSTISANSQLATHGFTGQRSLPNLPQKNIVQQPLPTEWDFQGLPIHKYENEFYVFNNNQ